MFDMNRSKTELWRSKLPGDIQAAMDEPSFAENHDSVSEAICLELNNASENDYLRIIRKFASELAAMPGASRVHLLSQLSGKLYPFSVDTFHRIVTDDEEQEGSGQAGGKGSVRILFLEDIKRLNEAISARLAQDFVDGFSLDVIRSAADEVVPGF